MTGDELEPYEYEMLLNAAYEGARVPTDGDEEGGEPDVGFDRCAGSTIFQGGLSPFEDVMPGYMLRRNRPVARAGLRSGGPARRWPAVTQTGHGMRPSWGWLEYPPTNLIFLGRPVVVRRGDVLHIDADDQQPAMIFVVLEELLPDERADSIHLRGYQVDADLRVIRHRDIYLRHPDGIEAAIPRWRVCDFEAIPYDL